MMRFSDRMVAERVQTFWAASASAVREPWDGKRSVRVRRSRAPEGSAMRA
jgi:hypothetical protein